MSQSIIKQKLSILGLTHQTLYILYKHVRSEKLACIMRNRQLLKKSRI